MMARAKWLMPMLWLLLLLSSVAALMLGPVSLSVSDMMAALLGRDQGIAATILLELRLPRLLIGLAVGAMLGISGAAMQGYLRNPLAEPSILGTSNAAALGAVAAFYFGWAAYNPLLLPLLSIFCACAALALLSLLAGRSDSILTLILAGIAIGTLSGAAISLALNLSPNPFAAMEIMTWLMGSLENRAFDHLRIALPPIIIGIALLMLDGRALDALSLGADSAQSLGVNMKATRLRLLLGVSIGVGAAVAVAGAIGFVGLIVPHLLRPFTDCSPSSLLFPSAVAGALLLTLSDLAVRLLPTTNELRLGVVTAFLGVPIFLFHLMRERRLW